MLAVAGNKDKTGMIEAISNFHFIRPGWLLALLPLAWAVWRIGRGIEDSAWSRWCDRALLPYILLPDDSEQHQGTRRRNVLAKKLWLTAAGIIAILAASGPAWEKQPLPVFPDESALVILLSLSADMNVSDVLPNRLTQARYKIKDLLSRRKEGSVALIVYGGDAFVVSPLTEDAANIEVQLDSLDSSIMPVRGQRAARALALAVELLDNAGHDTGEVLLVASGDDAITSAMEQGQRLFSQGRRLFVMGVGTTAGAPLPEGGGFVKDKEGKIVFSRRDDEALASLAQAGGGFYRVLGSDSSDIGSVVAAIDSLAHGAGDEAAGESQETTFWLDRGAWLLLPLLPLAALVFRRGMLISLAMVMVLPMYLLPTPAMAAGFWDNMWQRPDQQAAELFDQGREAAAARKFKDRNWKAAAYYRAGNYQEVELLLRGVRDDVLAMYMRANALAQLELYQEALGVYERILELEPGHEDARFNRELVRDKLRGDDGEAGDGQQSQDADGEQGEQGEQGEDQGQGQQAMQQQGEGQQAQMMQQGEQGESEGQQGQAGSSDDGTGEEQQGGEQQYMVPKEESDIAENEGEDGQQAFMEGGDEADKDKDKDGEQTMLLSDDKDGDGSDDSEAGDKKLRYMTPEQREQHMAADIWMRNIDGNDSSFLRHKFQRQHQNRRKGSK